jgi:hypothetical protein
MNNKNAENSINECNKDLSGIEYILKNNSSLSSLSRYLTLYALIKVTGTLEFSYKNIIADYYISYSSQIKEYLTNTIKESSSNPSYDNINHLLKSFDENKSDLFKKDTSNKDRNKSSLNSLNHLRNRFAHGYSIDTSFSDIKQYFIDSLDIIYILDSILTPN